MGTPFTEFRPDQWCWVCNWTWKEPPKPLKRGGKVVEVELQEEELPHIAAKVVGTPTPDSITVKPVWGEICEECVASGEFPPESQPRELPLANDDSDMAPYLIAMDKTNEDGQEDMVNLADLKVGELMHNLRIRYKAKPMQYFTYVDNILIVMNPLHKTDDVDEAHRELYKNKPLKESGLPPHIYAIGDEAYRTMAETQQNVSIVISGESGAGKSESTKLVLEYIAFAAKNDGNTDINEKIVATSEVLEAFGNAKTKRNHNSSRFGKFVEIQFDSSGTIRGAQIVQYLLEVSRIVEQEATERNYHIFYLMLQSLERGRLDELGLTRVEDYRYLIGPEGANIQSYKYKKDMKTDIGDDKRWGDYQKFLGKLAIEQAYQDKLLDVMAAILHLGQIDFVPGEGNDMCAYADEAPLQHVARLLQVDYDALSLSLRQREVMKGSFSFFSVKQAKANLDALAKSIYGAVFVSLVEDKINSTIHSEMPGPWIGVLDIFGFESFQKTMPPENSRDVAWVDTRNKFEQLCINLTNEMLQNFFYVRLIPKQIDKYHKEGLTGISDIVFADNEPCVHLIMGGKKSVFTLLNQTTSFANTNRDMQKTPLLADKKWIQDIRKTYKDSHENLKLPVNMRRKKDADFIGYMKRDLKRGKDETEFCIYHYAGQVWYTAVGAIERNKDKLSVDTISVINSSGDDFVKALLPQPEQAAGKKSGTQTVASKFKAQLENLHTSLEETEPFFVRCVKPNCMMYGDGYLEDHKVLEQLVCAGMYAVIEMRQTGYPVERTPEVFMRTYGEIEDDKSLIVNLSAADACRHICNKVQAEYADDVTNPEGLPPWQMGATKLFMKDNMFKAIGRALNRALAAKREKMRVGIEVVKALAKMQKELSLFPEREQKAAELAVWKARKIETMEVHNCSPEEAEAIMREEDEIAYRNEHLLPLQESVPNASVDVPQLVAAIDEFMAGSKKADEKKDLIRRKKALMTTSRDLEGAFTKFVDDYHNTELEAKVTELLTTLQTMIPAEREQMVADHARREWEIAEEARLEAERLEAERQAKLKAEREERERKERERREAIEAERQRRYNEKHKKEIEAQKARERVLAKRREEAEAERERVKAIQEREEKLARKREKHKQKQARAEARVIAHTNARRQAMVGTKVKYAHMLCTVKYFGPLPYETSKNAPEFVGLECPERLGEMNDGSVMGIQVMNVRRGRGKFVLPSSLYVVKPTKHTASVGDLVWYKGREIVGHIRYIGNVHFDDQVWVGLELLARGTGRHNGTVDGHRYFTCAEYTGVFVRPDRLCAVLPWSQEFVEKVTDEYEVLHPFTADWVSSSTSSSELERAILARKGGIDTTTGASELCDVSVSSEPPVVILPSPTATPRSTPPPSEVGGERERRVRSERKRRQTQQQQQPTRLRATTQPLTRLAPNTAGMSHANYRSQRVRVRSPGSYSPQQRSYDGSYTSNNNSYVSERPTRLSQSARKRDSGRRRGSKKRVSESYEPVSPFTGRSVAANPPPNHPDHYIVNGWKILSP